MDQVIVKRFASPKLVGVYLGNRLLCNFYKATTEANQYVPDCLNVKQGETVVGYIFSPDKIVDK